MATTTACVVMATNKTLWRILDTRVVGASCMMTSKSKRLRLTYECLHSVMNETLRNDFVDRNG